MSTIIKHYNLSQVANPDNTLSMADVIAAYLDAHRESAPSCYFLADYADKFLLADEIVQLETEHGVGSWARLADGSEIGVPSHGDAT